MNGPSQLTAFQLEVAQIFFGLTASEGFVLAGGAALLANDLTSRPTLDLDFFRSTLSVTAARDELEAAANDRGWAVARLRDHDTFVRLRLDGPETLLVDLCLDSPPLRPLVDTIAGPTFAPDELAGRKVVALFGRAEARDFADVFALLRRYPKQELLELAAENDAGSIRRCSRRCCAASSDTTTLDSPPGAPQQTRSARRSSCGRPNSRLTRRAPNGSSPTEAETSARAAPRTARRLPACERLGALAPSGSR